MHLSNATAHVQVPIYELLHKFDGVREHEATATGRRTLRLLSLPRYLLLSITRFTKNRFFVEKNPTIVNFPAKNLNLKGSIAELPRKAHAPPPVYGYNLLASISHVGPGRPEGVYKAFVHRAAEGTWVEVQDLLLQETQAEAVVITEAYLQARRLRGAPAWHAQRCAALSSRALCLACVQLCVHISASGTTGKQASIEASVPSASVLLAIVSLCTSSQPAFSGICRCTSGMARPAAAAPGGHQQRAPRSRSSVSARRAW
jgi:Ubiquitin carboxyl-terminal hydrolase